MSRHKKGFTMIELMIAMVFLGTLLVTIAILVIHLISIFEKGMNIKAVNSAGRSLIDDFTRTLGASLNVEFTGGVSSYWYQETGSATPDKNGPEKGNLPMRGAFCTAQFSYVWNTGYALNPEYHASRQPYVITESTNASGVTTINFHNASEKPNAVPFQLIKIQDPTRQICATHTGAGVLPKVDPQVGLAALEMLNTTNETNATTGGITKMSAGNLALYDFKVFPPVRNESTKHIFYSATFILATLRGGVDIMASENYCTDRSLAGTLVTDFNYCAINKFNFSMRATGETKKGENE